MQYQFYNSNIHDNNNKFINLDILNNLPSKLKKLVIISYGKIVINIGIEINNLPNILHLVLVKIKINFDNLP